MSPSEPLSPDEIEQRQSAVPDDEAAELYDADRPLTPDEIEQRLEAGFDDEDQPVDDER